MQVGRCSATTVVGMIANIRVDTPDGVQLAVTDPGGDAPPLLAVHATGFCGEVLRPMCAAMGDAYRCITFDQRGHGMSSPPADRNFDWHGFATDVLSVVDALGLTRPAGFGHSCGGAALLLAEEARPGTFSALYCYEPVVYPSDEPLDPSMDNNPLSAGAMRRRETFASREEALANFAAKAPFDCLDPQVLAAYVECGFVTGPEGDGGPVSLACERENEALVYANGFSHDAYARLGEVACPVTLACGSETDAFGVDFLQAFAARLPKSRVLVMEGLGHFGPLENPRTLADSLLGSLADTASA